MSAKKSPPVEFTPEKIARIREMREKWYEIVDPERTMITPERVIHQWQVVTGAKVGDPRLGDTDRTKVHRSKRGVYKKEYNITGTNLSIALMNNERDIFNYLGRAHDNDNRLVRQHINRLVGVTIDGSAFADYIETLDAGANLQIWQNWVPFIWGEANKEPMPLFAHPDFLAALVYRALLALQRFAEAELVHCDVWDANLCIADWDTEVGLLKNCSREQTVLPFTVNLRDVPLRIIDFETALHKKLQHNFPLVSPQARAMNSWVSPRLVSILQTQNKTQIVRELDGRVDLWGLGWMLRNWVANAMGYWGISNLEWYSELVKLELFAIKLQAYAPDIFTEGELWDPDHDFPHEALRQELAAHFPILKPDGPHPQWQVYMLNPAPITPRWRWLKKTVMPTIVVGSVGMAVTHWDAQSIARLAEPHLITALTQARETDSLWAGQQAQWGLKLLDDTTRTTVLFKSLQMQPPLSTWLEAGSDKTATAWLQDRNQAARGLVQLAYLPTSVLQAQRNVPWVQAQVERLYVAQARLTAHHLMNPSELGSDHTHMVLKDMDVAALLDVLGRIRLHIPAQPLSHLMWIQYTACQVPVQRLSVSSALDDLAQDWPRTGKSMPTPLQDWSQRMRAALQAGTSICLH